MKQNINFPKQEYITEWRTPSDQSVFLYRVINYKFNTFEWKVVVTDAITHMEFLYPNNEYSIKEIEKKFKCKFNFLS